MLGLITLSLALFATTNIDDLLVLVGFFADRRVQARQVVLGQGLGIGALFAASVAGSLVSLVVAPEVVGALGLVPIVLGLKKAWELRRGSDATLASLEDHAAASTRHGNIAAVAAVTIANGGDNLGVYTPWFATRSGAELVVVGIVFALMTLAWLAVAHWLVNHRAFGAPIRRHGHRVVPFVLIALGVWILHDAGTLRLLAGR